MMVSNVFLFILVTEQNCVLKDELIRLYTYTCM